MNVSSKQKTAQQMAGFLKDRRNAQGGYVSIVYKNENGENCTGYCDLMEVEIEVDGTTITVKEMFEHFYELEKRVEEYKILADQATETANKALQVAQNMERYMPTDYVAI